MMMSMTVLGVTVVVVATPMYLASIRPMGYRALKNKYGTARRRKTLDTIVLVV